MSALAIGIVGATGKMGRMLVETVATTDGVRLAAATVRPGSPHLGEDATARLGLVRSDVELTTDLDEALARAQVFIDFTAPPATAEFAARAAERGVPVVIGTTGLADSELAAVRRAAERIPVVLSANMSLGVNVVFGLLAQATRALGPGYDVEIVELHHRLKKDAPSGTALALAEVVAKNRKVALAEAIRTGRSGQVGARTPDEIGVLAVRGGDIIGEHTVYLCGLGERVELRHQASSRLTFARGAVRAARWLAERGQAGLYDMQDVLGLRT